LSIDRTILEELKDQILLIDDSLSNKIFIGHNADEQTALPEFVRLSLADTTPSPLTIHAQLKNSIVLINYYIKSDVKADYKRTSELNDIIQQNMPVTNGDNWIDCECIGESYEIDQPDENNEYEGFILEYAFAYIQTLTCKVPKYLYTDKVYPMITEDGYRIIAE